MKAQDFDVQDASHVSADQLRRAMLEAFSDSAVPLHLAPLDFELMMQQRGLHRALSRVALVEGEVIAIWLVSARGPHGYLISSGTRPQDRSRGVSRALAVSALQGLRAAGLQSFQTEVLRENETALRLYLSLGMTPRREFDCYAVDAPTVAPPEPLAVRSLCWTALR